MLERHVRHDHRFNQGTLSPLLDIGDAVILHEASLKKSKIKDARLKKQRQLLEEALYLMTEADVPLT